MNFFVESVRIIDLFFRQLSSVFYSGGTRSSIIFCLFDRFYFFAFIHGTSLQSARHQIELTHFLVFSYATNYNKTLFSFDGGDLWRSEKTTTTYRHIPQYPELSCYAKKKNKKNTFVWGCLWLCCCFLIRLCVLTLQKDQCIALLVVWCHILLLPFERDTHQNSRNPTIWVWLDIWDFAYYWKSLVPV